MRTLGLRTWTLGFAAIAAASAMAGAQDGDRRGDRDGDRRGDHGGAAVRLLVEPPKDVTTIEAGEAAIDVQVVPLDASGARVTPRGRVIEVSSTEGEFVRVDGPYKFRFTPPANVAEPLTVRLRSWFKQVPEIGGEAKIVVVPRRPFERLVLVPTATSVDAGRSIDIEVRGIRTDGTTVPTGDHKILLVDLDGGGRIEAVAPNVFRYWAPGRHDGPGGRDGRDGRDGRHDGRPGESAAHLKVTLERYPRVSGEVSLVIVERRGSPRPGGGDNDDDADGVLWPGGAVKLLVWRTKSRDPKEDWNVVPRRDLPPAGKALVAPQPLQMVRVQILREDIRKIEVEWYVDRRSSVVRTDDDDPEGRLRKEKKGNRDDVVIKMETPENGDMLIVDLLLTTARGQILKEQFLMQRGRDRDNDGEKDRRK